MNDERSSLEGFWPKYRVLMVASIVPTIALVMYAVHEKKGHLDTGDWIVAILVGAGATVYVLALAHHAKRSRKESKDGRMG